MKNDKLIWMARVNDNRVFAQIINLKGHETLYSFNITDQTFDLFKKIKTIKSIKHFYLKTGSFVLNSKPKEVKFGNWKINLIGDNQHFEKLI